MKILDKSQSETSIQKEILIHRNLDHPNIVKLKETFEDKSRVYLVLEFCPGGELLRLVEPDVGLNEDFAHFFFFQLIHALNYLHNRGICHRDVKPENLLLDSSGNLKLIDFGFATVFKKGNSRRKLQTKCGTLLYMAPDVLQGSYEGDAADLWSALIVLMVLLRGCHPWEEASNACSHFNRFLKQPDTIFSRFPSKCRSLLVNGIKVDPKQRLDLNQVMADPWFIRPNPLIGLDHLISDSQLLQELFHDQEMPLDREDDMVAFTQPVLLTKFPDPSPVPVELKPAAKKVKTEFHSFSQPPMEDLTPKSPEGVSSGTSLFALPQKTNHANRISEFPTKLTRFYTDLSESEAVSRVKSILEQFLISLKETTVSNKISFSTVDKRKGVISGDVLFCKVGHEVLISFHKTRGDWLEFRRLYYLIRDSVNISKDI